MVNIVYLVVNIKRGNGLPWENEIKVNFFCIHLKVCIYISPLLSLSLQIGILIDICYNYAYL